MSEYRFVIDGPDGAGKTTLCAELRKFMLERGYADEVIVVGDPNHVLSGPDGTSVRDIILAPHLKPTFTKAKQDHGCYTPLDPGPLPPAVAIPLILAGEAATLHVLENLPLANGNRVVIFDRWSTSTLVYQVLGQPRSDLLLPMVFDGYRAAHTHLDAQAMTGAFIVSFDDADVEIMFKRAHRGSDVYESANRDEHEAQLKNRNARFRYLEYLRDAGTHPYWNLITGGNRFTQLDAATPLETLVTSVALKINECIQRNDPLNFRNYP